MDNGLKKYKILIIEDDDLIRESLVFKMEKEGFEIDSASDGEVGIDKVKNNGPFSLILLDLRLPKNNGFEFLGELRKIKELSNLPVIVLTNSYTEEFADKALELGAKSYILKSKHDIHEIVEEVKKCLIEKKCVFYKN